LNITAIFRTRNNPTLPFFNWALAIERWPRNSPAARSEPHSRQLQLETESGAVFGRRLPAGLRPIEFSQLKIPNVALIQPGPDSAKSNVFFGQQLSVGSKIRIDRKST
jgi:hypothetical protein